MLKEMMNDSLTMLMGKELTNAHRLVCIPKPNLSDEEKSDCQYLSLKVMYYQVYKS